MKKLRSRKMNRMNYFIFGFILLVFTLSIGYSILTTNLNFSITATKNLPLILDDMMDRYGSQFYLYDGIYYNQGNNIYIKFNSQTWQILSVDTSQNTIKIMSSTPTSPTQFNTCSEGSLILCSKYAPDSSSVRPSAIYNLVSNPIVSADESKYLVAGIWHWGEVSPWGSDFTQKGLVDDTKRKIVYGRGGTISIEDYVMRIPQPSNPTKLENYQNAMNYLGLYYYDVWFMNSNGSSPITYQAGGGNMSNLVEPTLADRYRVVKMVMITDKVKLGSGIGTSASPYVIKG